MFGPVLDRLLKERLKLHTDFEYILLVYAPTNELKKDEDAVVYYKNCRWS